ncbi:hypothetical protein [Salinarimonas ramus]|uniref:Uncharacterized protein n=1 Tax=Salinarimonas ramus TaxID=690164 RepID=A0A917Q3I3_9HYPH|nr:hypothetical protein [Salinarimonas ramus]GGK20131.1 hypothetical protein GCM10011322_03530 [Salinarimonas ramus]
MWFNLIAIFVLGIAVAGSVMLGFKAFGRKPPRWILPIAAGIAMMTYTLYNDYSWFSRTAGALPQSVAVARSYEQTNPLQPWTYLFAPVNRFVAVGRVVPAPGETGYRMAEVHLLQRYVPTVTATMVFDCAGGRRADLVDLDGFDEAGEPIGGRWQPLTPDDPLRSVVCAEGGGPPSA